MPCLTFGAEVKLVTWTSRQPSRRYASTRCEGTYIYGNGGRSHLVGMPLDRNAGSNLVTAMISQLVQISQVCSVIGVWAAQTVRPRLPIVRVDHPTRPGTSNRDPVLPDAGHRYMTRRGEAKPTPFQGRPSMANRARACKQAGMAIQSRDSSLSNSMHETKSRHVRRLMIDPTEHPSSSSEACCTPCASSLARLAARSRSLAWRQLRDS